MEMNGGLKKTMSAILAEEACSRDLQDRHLDHGGTETEHAVIVAVRLIRLSKCTIARCLLVGDLPHKNDEGGWQHLPQCGLHLERRRLAKRPFFLLRVARDSGLNRNTVPDRCWCAEEQPHRSSARGQGSNSR